MEPFIIYITIAGLVLLAVKWLNRTDIPKIKGLPELPGVPMFGSLLLLGKHHARKCASLVRQYGDVFQVRLGNRVCAPETGQTRRGLIMAEDYLRELL
jgi:phenylacetate 2-hydroxylase